MKGLWKYISPFAPDHSGATAVFYELGGIIVICDAGGCTGNVCGFDEPRWFTRKSAIFSAGLRDMDAILGRDEKLVEKLKDTADKVEASFAAIIGTPVPAVIATDYKALKRMAEKSIGIPALTVDTDGMELYDIGASKAYLELFKRFTEENYPVEKGRIGVIGATPLDIPADTGTALINERLKADGYNKICCYGMNGTLEDIRKAAAAEINIVISPCGTDTAKWLKKKYGTPFELKYPLIPEYLRVKYNQLAGKKILIVNQIIAAQELADEIASEVGKNVDISIATWFTRQDSMFNSSIRPNGAAVDIIRMTEEDDFINLVKKGKFDTVIADKVLVKALNGFSGEFIDWAHFAVSGRTV